MPRPSKKWKGELAEPIFLGSFLPATNEELAKAVSAKKQEKFSLLMEHYGIEDGFMNSWLKLALRLAEEFVPGFEIRPEFPVRKKLKTFGAYCFYTCVTNLSETNKISITRAIEEFSHKTSKPIREDLAREYRKIKEQTDWIKAIAIMKDALYEEYSHLGIEYLQKDFEERAILYMIKSGEK